MQTVPLLPGVDPTRPGRLRASAAGGASAARPAFRPAPAVRQTLIAAPPGTLGVEQLAAASSRHARTTTSVTSALAAAAGGDADRVIVRLIGVDRFTDGWPGHRLIQRLVEHTRVEVIAAIDGGDYDSRALAEQLGAKPVPLAGGVPHRPALPDDADDETTPEEQIHGWFMARHSAAWQPWMEAGLIALASGADRSTQTEASRAAWRLGSGQTAQRRLRALRLILTDETGEHPGLERRAAAEVLRAIAIIRPIRGTPIVDRSLRRAAAIATDQPELLRGLPLTRDDLDALLAIAAAERELLGERRKRRGRPEGAAWRIRRAQAIGRVAASRAATADEKLALQSQLETALQDALLLIHDALEDAAR